MIVGGGGGYELDNKIDVYQMRDLGSKLLKDLVDFELTGDGISNSFELGSQNMNILAACVTAKIILYKIDVSTKVELVKLPPKDSKEQPVRTPSHVLIKLMEFTADFGKGELASLNCCKFS